MQFESWRIYHLAKNVLPAGFLQKLYTRSSRLIDLWAANPRFCGETARNPLDRCRALLQELAHTGYEDYAIATLDWMAAPLGRKTVPVSGATSEKNVDGEIADLALAMGHLASEVRSATADGIVDGEELLRIKRAALSLARESDQLLHAAGINAMAVKQ
jgi:hypothetical protein